jgi:pseudaminic acid biosynthesis-associated methylase
MSDTPQLDAWRGDFGREYTERSRFSLDDQNQHWMEVYGVRATDFFERNLEGVDRSARVLEVGCNLGNKLMLMQSLGFTDLYGIEPAAYAVTQARARNPGLDLLRADAMDLPFKDDFFDFVFTCGVLIHIHPDDLAQAQREILRVSKRWVFGYEYFSDEPAEMDYRGNDGLLFKRDFSAAYQQLDPALAVVRTENLPYLGEDLVDQAYLLERSGS